MDIKTSNLDFSAYLSCIGLELLDIEINEKGIAYWSYKVLEDADYWMDFLRDGQVSAVKYAQAIRQAKKQAWEGKNRPQVIVRRNHGRN